MLENYCQRAALRRREAARRQPNRAVRDCSSGRKNLEFMYHRVMGGNHDVMQNRECIIFERTHDTGQRIHKPWAYLWVPSSSRLQPIVGWITSILRDICRICPLEFLLLAAKKNNNAAKFLCVFVAKLCWRLHWLTINVLSFKKRPDISLYV